MSQINLKNTFFREIDWLMDSRVQVFSVILILYWKFLDAGIQDVSTSISIEYKIEYLDELIEMSVDDESDTHVEARDRRYSCLKCLMY